MTIFAAGWPYPRLIAHRGAGKSAPENTLSAMRHGARQGYRMFEYDVKLSRDQVPVLLHDATLDRTSNAVGAVAKYSFNELIQFDYGSWHGTEFCGEPMLSLYGMANFSIPLSLHSNIEIKPSPGLEAITGALVAEQARQLWQTAALPPLLSSFSTECLQAAALSAPELPRALLVEKPQATTSLIEQLQQLGCIGLNMDHRLIEADLVAACKAHNFFITAWTVNQPELARKLFELGVDAIITDNMDYPLLQAYSLYA